MAAYDEIFVGGAWVQPDGAERIPVHNPATEEVLASVPVSTPGDDDPAVIDARAAFDSW